MSFSSGLGDDISILDVDGGRESTCPKCRMDLPPLSTGQCRGCNRLKNRRTYLANRYERNKRIAADRKANPEKYRRQKRKSYWKNVEKERARSRANKALEREAARG